jgi:ABC-type multidrug transport system fused ATPase/permease subunit
MFLFLVRGEADEGRRIGMKTVDADARHKISGIRQGIVGVGLLVVAYLLWAGRDVIPDRVTTRVVATASFTLLHGASEANLRQAFTAATVNSPAEATFEREGKPDPHGATYYLHVTADTPWQAKADLETLDDAVKAAFPSAERDLMVSSNNSTVAAPNAASRHLSMAVHVALFLLMLGGQFLIVVGAWHEGRGRAGVLVALATPFFFLIIPWTDTAGRTRARTPSTFFIADWHFVLLLLVLTPLAVILGLWLTRRRARSTIARPEASRSGR